MGQINDAHATTQEVAQRLGNAVEVHQSIQQNGIFLGDGTNAYQASWRLALEDLLQNNVADFDYLELLS